VVAVVTAVSLVITGVLLIAGGFAVARFLELLGFRW
jgi:hypothetical protein